MVAVAQSWLEHPVVAREVGGSIPLSHPQTSLPSWLNWIEHWVSAPAVTGSNPVEGTTQESPLIKNTSKIAKYIHIIPHIVIIRYG